MSWPHPSARRLRRWMAAPDDGRTERHLQRCDRCSARVDESMDDDAMRRYLADAVSPPGDAASLSIEALRERERSTRWTFAALLSAFLNWLRTGRAHRG